MADYGDANQFQELKELIQEHGIIRGSRRLSSGKVSNYFFDIRRIALRPDGARLLGFMLGTRARQYSVDAVGGMETGAIPLVAAVIHENMWLSTPSNDPRGFYVRKQPKQYGAKRDIEGNLRKGDLVVILEDVFTTGDTVLKAVKAVRRAGGHVVHVLGVVDRGEGGIEAIRKSGHSVSALYRASSFNLKGD